MYPMDKKREPSRLGWILLPFFAALSLTLYPRPLQVQDNLNNARAALIEGNPRAATDALGRILAYYPERGDLWALAGARALEAGLAAEAVADYKKALSLGQAGLNGQISLGDAYQANHDPADALAAWSAAIQQYGPSEEIYDRLVHTYLDQSNYPEALKCLTDWAAWQPDNSKVLYQTGLLLAASRPQDGLPYLLKAEKLDSGLSPSVKLLQSRINSTTSASDPALTLLQSGRALGELGEWRLAAEAFNQAIKISSNFAEAWAFEGEARQQLGEEGQTYLDHAITLDSNSVLVMALQAISLERHGKAEEALVYLHTIADKEPKNGVWQVELGNALSQIGDLQTALSYYQNAVQLEPENPSLWRALANYCLVFNTQIDTIGLPAARQAVVLAPNDPAGLDLLGQAMVKLGDYSSAERFFFRAVQNNPAFSLAYLHQGMMYLDQGLNDKAYLSLRHVVELAADQPEGQQAQRLLARFFPQ